MTHKKYITATKKQTPLMEQYYTFKNKYPDAILLFRVGDFYETFGEDAVVASSVLDIVLTKRANGTASEIALAGFPHHALDNYLPKLIKAGHRVAVCDQKETPEAARARGSKVVSRKLIEVATPALASSEGLLKEKENRYLAALYLDKKVDGLALLDISTGAFFAYEGKPAEVWTQLEAHSPAELIFSKEQQKVIRPRLTEALPTFAQEPWMYTLTVAKERLLQHFGTAHLRGFGVDHLQTGLIAAGAILQYLQDTAHTTLEHISSLRRLDEESHLWMDNFTVRNLELLKPLQKDGKSLVEVIDATHTPMGGRLLRRWLRYPLQELGLIEERQSCVAYLYEQSDLRAQLKEQLDALGDLERLASKIALRRIIPRELLRIAQALQHIKRIQLLLSQVSCPQLKAICEKLQSCESLSDELMRSLRPDAALSPAQGQIFRKGYHNELDQLLNLAEDDQKALQNIQKEEIQKTGISSLKIGYNRVYGYYLEVRNAHKHKVPSDWIRKQTLTGAERYITQNLRAHEERVLSAQAQRIALEEQIYEALLMTVLSNLPALQENAIALAQIDVLTGWANIAATRHYVRPELNQNPGITIRQGRHPVIEAHLPPGEGYVPNDLLLDSQKQQILLITGPNMAGKSALLRQTALIVILAQIGAFVPATSVRIGICDKVFTRVGASDNISAAQSTFMIEMSETANILHNMSHRSLLLMDEVGRGTSTYDGLSVAWAILEYIHAHSRSLLLFATHYHELNELSDRLERMQSFHIAVKEVDKQIIFLHTLQAGGTQHSFGIHVARMAGIPKAVVNRAEEILASLQKQRKRAQRLKTQFHNKEKGQPSLF